MSSSFRVASSSTAQLQALELMRRQLQPKAASHAATTARGPAPAAARFDSGRSSFELAGSPRARGPNLTGESPVLVQYQPPTPTPPAPGFTPVASDGRGALGDIPLGELSHQDGTSYSANVPEVVAGTVPGASYCAATAFDMLREALPQWTTAESIDAVLLEHRVRSSGAIWEQLVASGAFGGHQPSGYMEGLDPSPGGISEAALPGGQPIPVELDSGDGPPLRFEATEVEFALVPQTLNPEAAVSTLESLGDMEVGEMRAVIMRPLNYGGSSANNVTGHWVVVERTEEGYRLTQSAPEDWALLGGASPDAAQGGVYVHEFTGDSALEDVSTYIHAEAQYSAAQGTEDASAGMYAVAVLRPVLPPDA
ncbi:hypothetical protein [Corallococcus macrosporus]|uniref:Uncharacterized protein n=1 Tax=Myxococcus fulvus (strain ATCC BAA-855 / HW-1) TaxID=483219 RepID=F8CIN7_MYXFH|nr:hypothetical protein [Corallococcus macrosporus]AEI66303.1 hypothetical protein LILAB_22020 [Corallococcus macrosporus]